MHIHTVGRRGAARRARAVCGDCLGANLEFRSMAEIRRAYGTVRDFKHSAQRARGDYTDDGESLLALTSAVVACGGAPTEACVVQHYADAFERGRRGYGPTASGILRALARRQTTPDVSGRMFYADGSHGNGCLMRIAPLGALGALRGHSVDALRANVLLATRCTHCHVEALDAALVYCVLVQRLFAEPRRRPPRVAATVADADADAALLGDAHALLALVADTLDAHCTIAYTRDKFALLRARADALFRATLRAARVRRARVAPNHRWPS